MSKSTKSRGFTLVELLVVMGIIGLLISILLPSLQKARRAANTVSCAANLRSILQAVAIHAAQNKGAIPGSPGTTGRFALDQDYKLLAAYSNNNFPTISTLMDWQAPIAKAMGVKFDEGPTTASRKARFEQLRKLPQFQCPENTFLAGPFVPGAPVAPSYDVSISYITASYFLYLPYSMAPKAAAFRVAFPSDPTSPSGYGPVLSKVKNSSKKIYIADGARYSSPPNTPPDIDLSIDGSGGGAYSDVGPFTSISHSWNRTLSPGNGGTGIDCRAFAYRHGIRANPNKPSPADMYKMNAGFFDGHVELLGDFESADPSYWMPTGMVYDPFGSAPATLDVVKKLKFNVKAAVK